MDFRSFHPIHDLGTQHIINELYLKDLKLQLATLTQVYFKILRSLKLASKPSVAC